MKKKDFLLIAAILLLAGVVWITLRLGDRPSGSMLTITVDDQAYGEYPLHVDRTIEIGDTNVCVIEGGVVSMTEADCPDLICVHTKAIDEKGGTIVCMPNRVVLEITGSHGDVPDAVAQ